MCKFFCNFAADMWKNSFFIFILAAFLASCGHENTIDRYRAQKHVRDSVSLEEQERSLAFYESQLENIMPTADSLLALFHYEKNAKYQDHGYYVTTGTNGLRILVRDDGRYLLMYRNGKRVTENAEQWKGKDREAYDRARHLQIVISDIRKLEHRISRTSLEVQKYQHRLQK